MTVRRRSRWLAAAVVGGALLSLGSTQQKPRLVILLVIDGLRPDAITSAVTPTLARLRDEGVTWRRSHAMVPTVTRVNSATLGTGTTPAAHGIVSNVLVAPALDSMPLNTADPNRLMAMGRAEGRADGNPVPMRTIADRVTRAGMRFVAVSAGSGGNALLNAPTAPNGVGTLINHNLGLGSGAPAAESWRVGYPDSVSAAVRARIGMPPGDSAGSTLLGLQDWADRVVREYVLPTLVVPATRGAMVMLWTAEPDEAQHRFGVGSPEATEALRGLDRNIGRLLTTLDSLGLAPSTDVIVVSDHGFAWNRDGVNVVDSLVAAGLKASRTSADVTVASDGQSVQLHLRGDTSRTRAVATWLLARPWVDVVFAPRTMPATGRPRCHAGTGVAGWIPGTVALEALAVCNEAHGPDLLVTLPWTDAPNAFGVPGTQLVAVDRAQGPIAGNRGGHGGLSPWTVHNTMLAWGSHFRRGAVLDQPAGNVDVPRTALALLGIADTAGLAGRVLVEALRVSTAGAPARMRTWEDTVRAPGGTRVVLRRSAIGPHSYVDAAWRVR